METLLEAIRNSPACMPHSHASLSIPSGSPTAWEHDAQNTKLQTAKFDGQFQPVSRVAPANPLINSAAADLALRHVQHTFGTPHHPSAQFNCIYHLRGPKPPHHLRGDRNQNVPEINRLQTAQRAVVLVKLTSGWASGVIVDTKLGLLLTNAHLFEQRGLQELPSPTSSRQHEPCTADRVVGGEIQGMKEHTTAPMSFATSTEHRQPCSSSSFGPVRFRRQPCQVLIWTHTAGCIG